MLAYLDMQEQVAHLAMVVMAILQPLVVLVLVFGLMVASAHLLTMLGTRWGDRRTSSKSLFFSIAVHVLLAGGILALVPEYRARLIAEMAETERVPLHFDAKLQPSERDVPHVQPGNVPLWEQIPQPSPTEIARAETPQDLAPAAVPSQPLAPPEFTPELSEDRPDLPPESRPIPQAEVAAQPAPLQEAVSQMQVDAAERQVRPETAPPPAERRRASLVNPGQSDPQAPVRPSLGSVDRLTPTPDTNRQTRVLTDAPAPDATVRRAELDETVARREGPAPANATAELVGRSDIGQNSASVGIGPVEPQLSRSPLRSTFPSESETAPDVYRPSMRPTLPDQERLPPEASVSSSNRLTGDLTQSPQLARSPDFSPSPQSVPQVPAAYTLRTEEQRQIAIQQYGGSEESEKAVDRALAWLASTQEPEGYWDASRYDAGLVGVDEMGIDREHAGREADSGVTALAVLAFMGKLNTLDEGKYSENVNRALRWLVAQQRTINWRDWDGEGISAGFLGGGAGKYAGLYCHAISTFALAEAYAMSKDSVEAQWLRQPIEQAVALILETQISDGSWRYVKNQPYGDMSVFGWQLMALKSAETAGIPIPPQTKEAMVRFLQSARKGRNGGLASYRQVRFPDGTSDPPSPAMTAEAMFCRQMLGLAEDPAMNREAVEYLLDHRPSRSAMNLYYWYYGTLAMHQYGGRDWDEWNLAVRDLLISEQRTSGTLAGSWDPRGTWGPYGGRVYSTAVSTLTLEVYYRYLPLYRLNQRR